MQYTENQYKELAKRFNKKSTDAKLILIRMHPNIFKLEFDGTWYAIRLWDEEAQEKELDMLFELDNMLLENKDLSGIKIYKVK